MELLEQHARAMEEFDQRVRMVGDDQWHASTPCRDWDVRALVDHVVTEQLWVPHLLSGATLADVGDRFDGDQLAGDPVAVWARVAGPAREALARPGALETTVDTSMGELPTREYARQLTLDLAVHAWDLARGIGVDDELDGELVAALHEVWAPRAPELAATGRFAPPLPVDDDADAQGRLLAVLGRRER